MSLFNKYFLPIPSSARFFRCLIVAAAWNGHALHAQEARSTKPALTAESSPSSSGTGALSIVEAAPANPADGERALSMMSTGTEVSSIPKRFQYALRLSLRGVYDDNITLSPADPVSDFYFAIEPGITLGYGDIVGQDRNYIRFDYAPSIFVYAEHSGANAFQHLASLEAWYRTGRMTLSLVQSVQVQDGANPAQTASATNPGTGVNLDAGGNTRVNTYSTRANMSLDLTGKTFLSGGLDFSANEYPDLISSESLSGNLFINYTYSPKLTVGIGGTFGYNWVESTSPGQKFEQVNVRVTYQLTGKISINGSAGLEFRQYEGASNDGNNLSPVYEISASYQPFDGTSLNLSGRRRTQNSAVLQGQDFASTNITLGARQRLLRRIYLGLVLGYENSSYFSTITGLDSSRDDNYFFLQPSVDVTITNFWTVGAYYLHRRNDSSAELFSFNDNQVGLRTSLTF